MPNRVLREIKMSFCYIFLFAIMVKCLHAGSDDVFTDIKTTSSYILRCPTSSSQEFVLWYKENDSGEEEELGFTDEKIFFPKLNEVEISNLRPSDSGLYKCTTLNGQVIHQFNLEIVDSAATQKPPAGLKPEWSRLPDPYVTADNSKRLILPCRTKDSSDEVAAYKVVDGKDVKLRDKGLLLMKPKGSDSGRYKCEAKNAYGTSTHHFEVSIRVNGKLSEWSEWGECETECGFGYRTRTRTCTNPPPSNGGLPCFGRKMERGQCKKRKCSSPRFTKFGYDMTGGDLVLDCAGTGFPKPSAEWKFRSQPLPKEYHTKTDGRVIIPKDKARSGSYMCTIQNTAAYYSMYINIDV